MVNMAYEFQKDLDNNDLIWLHVDLSHHSHGRDLITSIPCLGSKPALIHLWMTKKTPSFLSIMHVVFILLAKDYCYNLR
jgi:hypothetical protein